MGKFGEYYSLKDSTNNNKITVNESAVKETTTISSISSNGNTYTIDSANTMQDEITKIWERLNKTVSMVHNCANCGAQLEIEENKPVFHCKYCGSTYVIGSTQIHSHY